MLTLGAFHLNVVCGNDYAVKKWREMLRPSPNTSYSE